MLVDPRKCSAETVPEVVDEERCNPGKKRATVWGATIQPPTGEFVLAKQSAEWE
jgi:hypothetical protein